MTQADPLINEFVIESRENLDRFERDLVALEMNPHARETLDSAFRAIHSIKGVTGFLGLEKLGRVAHAGESLLSRMREGVIIIGPEIASGLLALVDYTRRVLAAIKQSGVAGDADDHELVLNLERLATGAGTRDPTTLTSTTFPGAAAIRASGAAPALSTSSPLPPSSGNIRVDVAQRTLAGMAAELQKIVGVFKYANGKDATGVLVN